MNLHSLLILSLHQKKCNQRVQKKLQLEKECKGRIENIQNLLIHQVQALVRHQLIIKEEKHQDLEKREDTHREFQKGTDHILLRTQNKNTIEEEEIIDYY